jgi:hypothetical protein
LNPELPRLVAEWERDPLLFEPIELLRRIEVLDLLDRHFPEANFAMSDLRPIGAAAAAGDRLRVEAFRAHIEAANESVYEDVRAEIRRGNRPESLMRWVDLAQNEESADAGYGVLDELISSVFRFDEPADVGAEADPELVAYQPTPARCIFDLIHAAALTADDVLVDLGSGLGHVPLMTSICTPARSIGIEREAAYVEQARRCAARLNLGRVEFVQQDARAADLSAGTVFYLYTPFIGTVLRGVLDRLQREARMRPIRVCSYGPCTPMLAQESWLEAMTATGTRQVAFFRSRVAD